MLNQIDSIFGSRGEARLRYKDGEFDVLKRGDFVRCAVSGRPIPLAKLRYWSVDRQEAYASAEISIARYKELREIG